MATERKHQLIETAGLICFEDFEKQCHIQRDIYCNHLKKLKTFLDLGILHINARYEGGNTLLHIAAKDANYKAIKLLVNGGADPNIRSDSGETPMFRIFYSKASNERKRECVECLLLHGADYDIVNYEGDTVVNVALKNGSFFSLQPIVAHLAWLKDMQLSVDETIYHQIKFVRVLSHYYQACIKHLAEMKCQRIGDLNVTEYQVLAQDQEIIASYMRNSMVLRKFEEHQVCSDLYYNSLFQAQIQKATQIKRLRVDASIVFRKSIKLFQDCSHIIVDKITCHLSNDDLYALKHIVEEEEKKSSIFI